MSEPVSFFLAGLGAHDRRLLNDLAASAGGVHVETYALAIVSAYFTLLRDAPAVLPSGAIPTLHTRAQKLEMRG
jgi:hypothetical protein